MHAWQERRKDGMWLSLNQLILVGWACTGENVHAAEKEHQHRLGFSAAQD